MNQKNNQWATDQGYGFRLCCFICGELGHWISECNKLESHPKKNLLVDKDPINFTNNKDNSDNNGDVL